MNAKQEQLYLWASAKAKLVLACELLRDAISDVPIGTEDVHDLRVATRTALGNAMKARDLVFIEISKRYP